MRKFYWLTLSPTIKPRLLSRGWKQLQDSAPQKAIRRKQWALVSGASFLFIFIFFPILAKSEDKVCFKDTCFTVEIADTLEARRRGLMFRPRLEEDRGMIFVFESESKHSFWMKDTYIPLDMIWINSKERVVFIKKQAQPCSDDFCQPIYPKAEAKYVLEINAGFVDKLGINIGDKLDLRLEENPLKALP